MSTEQGVVHAVTALSPFLVSGGGDEQLRAYHSKVQTCCSAPSPTQGSQNVAERLRMLCCGAVQYGSRRITQSRARGCPSCSAVGCTYKQSSRHPPIEWGSRWYPNFVASRPGLGSLEEHDRPQVPRGDPVLPAPSVVLCFLVPAAISSYLAEVTTCCYLIFNFWQASVMCP